jgi:NADPH:quinone reductase-like Zn-dependent oxidoreductase
VNLQQLSKIEIDVNTMTAITTDRAGVMSVATVDRPQPGPTELLIRVAAAGVNPVDWKVRAAGGDGHMFPNADHIILGWDVAGAVVEVGFGVTRFAVGDRVFGMPRFPAPANAYAEYVVARSREVTRIPDSVSDIEAGAAPLAALTAWQAIVDTLHVRAGDRVLVHAASGGVGHLAVQLAKARGAQVWATASLSNHGLLRELGVDHPIDYRTERFEDIAHEMDAVLDLVGFGDTTVRSVAALRRGGQLVVFTSAATLPSNKLLEDAAVTMHQLLVEPDHTALAAMAEMMVSGTLRVVVGATRPLAQMAELHAIGEAGGPFGKLVATVT